VAHGGAPASFYIKTGGNASVTVGWDGGEQDKCCRTNAKSCDWWYSLADCQAALRNLSSCLPCPWGDADDLGCPWWLSTPPAPVPPSNVSQIQQLGSASVLLSASYNPPQASSGRVHHGGAVALPIALRNRVGAGTVVTVLLEQAAALKELGVLQYLLSRLSADVLPFDVLSASAGTDLLGSRLEMMLARASDSWQVTLINNAGVSKRPRRPAVVDPSKRVECLLRLKPGYGTVKRAALATEGGRALPLLHRGSGGGDGRSVELAVEAGGVAVIDVFVL
jgi:hypothetical protein